MRPALKALAILALYPLLATPLSVPAAAASVEATIAACDKMDAASPGSCGYSINKRGDIQGCSKSGCFYCPNDGKRECIAVRKVPTHSHVLPQVGGDLRKLAK